jgi:hypothetical protein
MPLDKLVPAGLKEHQEFTIEINLWNSLSPNDKSKFLGDHRLFLMRYVNEIKGQTTGVTLRKHSDATLVKKDICPVTNHLDKINVNV